MAWHIYLWNWLAHAALGALLILAAGCLAVRLCRQPVRRLRLAELTMLGCLLAPWLHLVPGLPGYPLGWLRAPPAGGDRLGSRGGRASSVQSSARSNDAGAIDRPDSERTDRGCRLRGSFPPFETGAGRRRDAAAGFHRVSPHAVAPRARLPRPDLRLCPLVAGRSGETLLPLPYDLRSPRSDG